MVNQNNEIAVSTECFDKILKIAEESCPDIALGIVLQMYVGLRVPEICSMYSDAAPCGGSITLLEKNGTVKISNNGQGMRIYQIPRDNIVQIQNAYHKHKTFVDEKCIDSRYPLFINARGTALSTDGYIRRVQFLNVLLTKCTDADVKKFTETLKSAGKRFTCDVLRRCRMVSGEQEH